MITKLPLSANPVHAIIRKAGGVDEIARESAATDATTGKPIGKPIGADAVHKWRRNGIPEEHWGLIIKLTGLDVETIYEANAELRRLTAGRHARAQSDPSVATSQAA